MQQNAIQKNTFFLFFSKKHYICGVKNEEYYVRKTKADIINKLR